MDFLAPQPDEDGPISVVPFPALHPDALTGFPGKIVNAVSPYTEAHPAAVLVQFLTVFGVYIGRQPHVLVANTRHPALLHPLVIGKTSSGAKGTSYAVVRAMFRGALVELDVPELVTASGLSSAEGLIQLVRDPNPDKDIPGVDDKRLLLVEEEFVSVLQKGARQGSDLMHKLRDAWDGTTLRTITKADPMVATGAHIGLIGHATPGELRARLADPSDSSLSGGNMNRMLPVASRRTRLLPDGGNLPDDLLAEIGTGVAEAVSHAGAMRWAEVQRTDAATELWRASYAELRRDRPDGPVAKMTARAAPQVLRLALAYALADSAVRVDEQHMRAALAVWRYAEQSAEWLFGGEVDSREVEALVAYIAAGGAAGRTREQIRSDHFQRNRAAAEIEPLLAELINDGRVRQEVDRSGRGRPSTRYHAC